MSLDFSKMRTAAYGLWSHSNRLFALSSSNALLEFLLDVSGIALSLVYYHVCKTECVDYYNARKYKIYQLQGRKIELQFGHFFFRVHHS